MAVREIIVVGAGAMGAAVAWHACRRDAADVVLIDRSHPSNGTSGLGAGVVHRLLREPMDIALVERSMDHLRTLSDEGRSFPSGWPGGLVIVDDEGPVPDAATRVWKAAGLDVERLAAAEVPDIVGADVVRVAEHEHAWWLANDGWCVATDAVRAMVDAAVDHGAELRTNTDIARIEDGAVHTVGGERLDADAVVVAAGVWTPKLMDGTWSTPIAAYRPQAASISCAHGDAMPVVHDAVHDTYWRPDGPERLVAGNGTVLEPQDVGSEPTVEPTFETSLVERLRDRLVAPQVHAVSTWAGFEAGTPDRQVLAGAVPGTEHTYVLAGGNGFGFMRASALGEAVAALALGRHPPLPVTGADPARFADRGGEPFPLREGFSLT